MPRPADSLPDWPRGLSRELAAAYVGVSQGRFVEEVKAGIWPRPDRRGRRLIWDRAAIDDAFDARTRSVARSGSTLAERVQRWAKSA